MSLTNKKQGFSLFEALVSMLVMSLFFIAASKVITQKQRVEIQRNPHGYYECYISGGMYQHRVSGNASINSAWTTNCTFEPPAGVTFINVFVYDGSEYFNYQQPIMNDTVSISDPAEAKSDFAQKINPDEFKTYLQMTHPSSDILKNWPTNKALFIAW